MPNSAEGWWPKRRTGVWSKWRKPIRPFSSVSDNGREMQNILPVLCFMAGFLLAWLVFRLRRRETEAAFQALSSDALARNNQAFLELAKFTLAESQQSAHG